ncbi:MAG: IS66 family transposase [Actinobacteria bacterium]|nr:IS66 family transposase [Actinomycetota bacterium]
MRREEAEAVALAGGEPARELVVQLIEQVAALGADVEELRRQVNRSSSNSSMPPSQDPPKSRAERRRQAREAYKRSMRKSGGQPGHEGKTREMAAPERVDHGFDHLPSACACGHCFSGGEERLGDPLLHQEWELPPISPLIFEHRLYRLVCPRCGKASLAELRSAGVSASAFGPRMEAHIAVLAGVYRLSRQQVSDIVAEIFGCPISTGAVDKTIMRMSAVLADPWAELREAVRKAEIVHADETSWRLAGAQQWLWLAASALHACYRIDPSRSQRAAKELLGEDFGGFVVSDRYVGYHFLDVLQQQLCWAHVIRQLTEISQRQGAAGKLGRSLVKAARAVIAAHRAYLEDGHELAWLAAELAPLRKRIEALLEKGARSRHAKTARFCAGLLEEYEALWTFCEAPGIEPTNNRAERALRHAVIMRKTQLGTQSDAGSRWVERICSIKETCRLQGRSTLGYLVDAATAAHQRQPLPPLAPP